MQSANRNSILSLFFKNIVFHKTIKNSLFITSTLVSLFFFTPIKSTAQTDENTVKAVLFERFTRFIEWDKDNNNKEFEIAVIGSNKEILNQLTQIYNRHNIKNKPVKITHINTLEELKKCKCSILFISENMSKNLEEIIEYTSRNSILTIGDSKSFAKRGVVINFFIKNSSVQFKINPTIAKKSNIQISYHLLKMAEIVEG